MIEAKWETKRIVLLVYDIQDFYYLLYNIYYYITHNIYYYITLNILI